MPDLSGAPPTLGSASSSSSTGKFQSQRGGRGRFNPTARGGRGGNNNNNNRGGKGSRPPTTNPSHPGHVPGSKASRPLNGVFAIDKPPGRTSMTLLEDLKTLCAFSPLFRNPDGTSPQEYITAKGWYPKEQWVQKYKKRCGPPKVGQGGTLDPLASGVLVIGLGTGTKQLQEYLHCAKTYTSVGLLGSSTTSYDVNDPIMYRRPHTHVTKDLIVSLLSYFTGPLLQYPPLYSAVRIDGKRLFEYARSNTPLPRPIPAREIEVKALDLVDWFDAGEHEWTAPDREVPEEEKALVGRVKEMVGQGEFDGDIVVKGDDKQAMQELRHDRNKTTDEEQEQQAETIAQTDATSTAEGEPAPAEEAAEHTTVEEQPAPAEAETTPAQTIPDESHLPPSAFRLRMTVSSGTYVRSIIHDVGLACESASHVVELRRTRQGEWFTSDHRHDEGEDELETSAQGERETGNVIPWDVFDNALKQLRLASHPEKTKADGQQGQSESGEKPDRELHEWEKLLLQRIKPT